MPTLFSEGGVLGRGSAALPPPPVRERKEIHITDLQTFNLCRRQWGWTSLLRMGLQPSKLPEPLFLGQAVHQAMEAGYKESIGHTMLFDREAAIEHYQSWVDSQMNRINKFSGPLWADYRGELEQMITLGSAMINHYGMWARKIDSRFKMLGTEELFKIALPGSRDLAYAGRFDGLIQDKSNGLIYVLEFKTSKYSSDKQLAGVFRSMQCAAYIWAARQVFNQPVVGLLYRILVKKMPDIPYYTKQGRFSYNKSQKMTEGWVLFCLEVIAHKTAESSGEDWQILFQSMKADAGDLLNMVRSKPNEFFIQRTMPKSQRQIADTVRAITEVGKLMADPHTPALECPMSGWHCNMCKFQDPCALINADDEESCAALLDAEYAPRDYWDKEDID